MSKQADFPLPIVVDTREQRPYLFADSRYHVNVSQGTLPIGDYSIQGLEKYVAVERKALQDLVQCLGRERERFARELEHARSLEAFAVIVESDFGTLATGEYRSRLNPHSACQSIAAFMARLHVPFFLAGNRDGGEYMVYSFLLQYVRGKARELDGIGKALGGLRL